MTADTEPCVVYGDFETCHELRADAIRAAAQCGLAPAAWFHDPTGLRGMVGPQHAPGLAEALAACAETGAVLLVPYAADMPGEQNTRIVAHWLERHGLRLFVGGREHLWSRPTDELDFAMRRQLDAAADLQLAVAIAGKIPNLDQLVSELLSSEGCRTHVDEARQLAATAGRHVPPEPAPSAPWHQRQQQVVNYAHWLSGHRSQAFIANVLNELGVRSRTGRAWSQPAVSRLLQNARDGRRVS